VLKKILPAAKLRFLSSKNVVDYLDCILAIVWQTWTPGADDWHDPSHFIWSWPH